jgi:glucose/arabinose dehydrogenase
LNDQRTEIDLLGQIDERISKGVEDVKPYKLAEGLGRITDLEIGPDGYLYIVSHNWNRELDQMNGTIWRLTPSNNTDR